MQRRQLLAGVLGAAGVSSIPRLAWSSTRRLAAPALVARLAEVRSGKLLVLHVGRASLHARQRVPGSRHGGESTTPAGYTALVSALRAAAHARQETVIYCGCCPPDHCVFLPPAEKALQEAGHSGASLLELPTNFDRDWVDKGYPVERS